MVEGSLNGAASRILFGMMILRESRGSLIWATVVSNASHLSLSSNRFLLYSSLSLTICLNMIQRQIYSNSVVSVNAPGSTVIEDCTLRENS